MGVRKMGYKNSWVALLVAMMVIIVVACDEEPEVESTPTMGVNQVTRLLPSQTPTLAPSATPIPIPNDRPANVVPEVTPLDTENIRPEPTLTARPSPTPIGPFTIRQPGIDEIDAYLLSISSDEFYFMTPLSELAVPYYEDVNGDGESDLIISDFLRVIILLWDEGEYTEPFMISRLPPWKYAPGSRIKFIDYTNDGVPEVIFDYLEDTGGTGIVHQDWKRFIIHCLNTCETVWEGRLAGYTDDYNGGGMYLFTADLSFETGSNKPTLRYYSHAFATYLYFPIYSLELYSPTFIDTPRSALTVFTSTVSVFEWNNNNFELKSEEIAALPQIVQGNSNLLGISLDGTTAEIKYTKISAPTNNNDRCELFVDGQLIGETFGCKSNFTTVEWKDITADGRDEIVIKALSGVVDPEYLFEIDADCVHQRIIAYEWDGQNARETINTFGCVVQDDLFGIKLEDFDSDGQVEIIAARWNYVEDCPPGKSEPGVYLLNCFRDLQYDLWIYKWNGSRFVYWDSVFGGLLSN